MFRKLIWRLVALLFVLAAAPASAAFNVFASVPEWAALAREIGGERVNVSAATNALQDPHRVDAKPSLIARARSAQLVIATGAGLEVGWLPVVLRESGNAGIQPGQPGYLEAAGLVRLLEVPARLDRADGDVHPGGNPHLHLDPRNIQKVADALAARLAQLDPAGAAVYKANHARFSERWKAAMARWEQAAAPLKGVPVWVQHRSPSTPTTSAVRSWPPTSRPRRPTTSSPRRTGRNWRPEAPITSSTSTLPPATPPRPSCWPPGAPRA